GLAQGAADLVQRRALLDGDRDRVAARPRVVRDLAERGDEGGRLVPDEVATPDQDGSGQEHGQVTLDPVGDLTPCTRLVFGVEHRRHVAEVLPVGSGGVGTGRYYFPRRLVRGAFAGQGLFQNRSRRGRVDHGPLLSGGPTGLAQPAGGADRAEPLRSEEHTSELQSREN